MTIFCRFNLFAMDSQIYAHYDGGSELLGTANLFDLAEMMTNFAGLDKYKTNKYHLYGPIKYAEMIAKQIKQLAASKYGENNVEVEIN